MRNDNLRRAAAAGFGAVVVLVAAGLPSAALAQSGAQPAGAQPAALVEDAPDGLAGVQVMDYVARGQSVTLAANQTLVLSYLHSCVIETIRGGSVTVGLRESEVTGGKVERKTLPCDGGRLLLAADQAGKAGVTVMRDAGIALKDAKPKPQITLHKTRPIIVASSPGPVTFEPLDGGGQALTVNLAGKTLDLAKGKTQLKAGALYRVSAAGKSYVVQVAPDARNEGGPALGRLLRF